MIVAQTMVTILWAASASMNAIAARENFIAGKKWTGYALAVNAVINAGFFILFAMLALAH